MTETDAAPYVIERNDVGADQFSHSVSFDESIAYEDDDRIETLADLLNREPQIERAHREDREFILLHAPTIDDRALEGVVARAWAAADR
jgi:hypothetical protein